MTRQEVKKCIDGIFINYLKLKKNFFKKQENDGENLVINDTFELTPLLKLEIIEGIEAKCKILLNDEKIFVEKQQYKDLIDIVMKEISRY